MDLAQARTEFLAYVAVERGLSVNTLDAYTRDLEGYLLWLNGKKITLPNQVTRSDVEEYIGSLRDLGMAPAWIVAVIICRELAVTGLRLLLVETGGTVLAAAMPGKIKTFSQMFAIIFLLLHWTLIGQVLLYVALFFTIYSGYDYFKGSAYVFKGTFGSK